MYFIMCCFFFSFRVKALLTEAQKLKPGDEHPLPWYPPVCVPLEDIPEGSTKSYDHIKSVSREERTRMPLKMTDKSMRLVILIFFSPKKYSLNKDIYH